MAQRNGNGLRRSLGGQQVAVEEDNFAPVSIPVDIPNPIAFKWAVGQQILVYPHRKHTDVFIEEPTDGAQTVELTFHNLYPEMRMTVAESHLRYKAAQGPAPGKPTGTPKMPSEIVHHSRYYRAILLDAHRQVREKLEQLYFNTTEDMNVSEAQVQRRQELVDRQYQLRVTQLLWHLIEIFLFDPSSPVLSRLWEWLELSFSMSIDPFINSFEQTGRIRDEEEYWSLIYQLLARGKVEQVHSLLNLYPNRPVYFDDVLYLVERIPKPEQFPTIGQFHKACKSLTDKVDQLLRQHDSSFESDDDSFLVLLQIMAGHIPTIKRYLIAWQDAIAAAVFFTAPAVKAGVLWELLEQLKLTPNTKISLVDGWHELGHFDNTIYDIIRLDISAVTRDIYEMENPWFRVHILDMMHQAQLLNDGKLPVFGGVTELQHALLEYVNFLIAQNMSLQIVADYLVPSCGEIGRAWLSTIVSRTPVRTEREAHQLIDLCNKYNLDTQRQRIQRVMARSRLSRGQAASAISWYEGIVSDDVAVKLLESLIVPVATMNQQAILNIDRVLETVSASIPIIKELQFLRLYADAARSFMSNDYRSAGRGLLHAIATDIAPRRFWLPILRDCAILLQQSPRIIYTVSEMHEVMRCLEDIEIDYDRDEFVSKFEQDLCKLDQRVLGDVAGARMGKQGSTEFNAMDEMDRMRLVFTQKLAAATVS